VVSPMAAKDSGWAMGWQMAKDNSSCT
jgi:hypothetical protein